MRKVFCVLFLYVSVPLHLRGPVNGSFVMNGPDGIGEIGGFCFRLWWPELMFLGSLYSGEAGDGLPAVVNSWWVWFCVFNHHGQWKVPRDVREVTHGSIE